MRLTLTALLFAASVTAVPVYVMLPLNTVTTDGKINDINGLKSSFQTMKSGNVDGIMTDVWWGVVERQGPKVYDWAAYQQLVALAHDAGLRVEIVMSFHQCGGNVGDDCNIPLPSWVLQVGRGNGDIFYTDSSGNRDPEYLSLGIDSQPILNGRTPVQVYSDFMESFRSTFSNDLGTTITEIEVGLGPAGELRYPAYQSTHWKFPGIGGFQCYDKYMLADLAVTAANAGHPEWGHSGPADAGNYNEAPENTGFFREGGSYNTPYGQFFLNWYAGRLIDHGEAILLAASGIFKNTPVRLSAKVAGVHWLYDTPSHAAELTAGYYNIYGRDGYLPMLAMFQKHQINLDFTMLEMTDRDNPASARSAPQELITSVFADAVRLGIGHSGENALARFDQSAYNQILAAAQYAGSKIDGFTYLRWGPTLLQGSNWSVFQNFVNQMHSLGEAKNIRPFVVPSPQVE